MKGLKAILFTAFLGAGMTGSAPLFAQGYLSDMTGVNAVLSRDPARQASTEIDAVLTNPAGTAFLEDGFHFSLNGMFAFRDVDVKDRETPFSSWQTDEKRFLRVSRNLVGIAIQLSDSEEKELFVHDSMQVSPE